MEELLTTEVLDREILEDARKKAHKILKTADDALMLQKQDWDKKTLDAKISLRNSYEKRLKDETDEVFARLPLDKRRLRSETAEGFLGGAMMAFLRSLSRDKLLAILELEFSERLNNCAADLEGANPEIMFSGMELSEAHKVLRGVDSAGKISGGKISAGEVSGGDLPGGNFPCIVVNTGAVKITASVESAAWVLLASKRAELVEALLGAEALDD